MRPFAYVCFCLSILSVACAPQVEESGDIRKTLLGATDDPEEKLTITWLGMPRFVEGQDGSWIQRRIEERFNIELKPAFIDWNAMQKRKPLMMLGGDIPDVLWVKDAQMIGVEARHGFLLELPYEVISKHAPAYDSLMAEYEGASWLHSYYDGKNYGMPTFGADWNHIYPASGVWRMDWLRNVGIDTVPDTLDEMYEAFRRFRYNDPDGNGEKDTYGLSLKPSNYGSMAPEIYGAFGLLYMEFQLRDGKLVWGGVQPEAKTVLALLRKWYEEELIEPEWAVTNHLPGVSRNKFCTGLVGYSRLFAMKHNLDPDAPGTDANIFYKMNPDGEMVPGTYPIGPDGQRGTLVRGGFQYVMSFGAHLRDQPEKVIRILRMFNEIVEDEQLALETRLGKRGLHWEFSPERGIHRLPPYDDPALASREVFNPVLPDPASGWGYFVPFGARLSLANRFLTAETRQFRDRYRRPEWAIRAALDNATLPSASKYLGELGYLTQLQAETTARIINGEVELDYFDTFVDEWYANGGAEVTREANELYLLLGELGNPMRGEEVLQ